MLESLFILDFQTTFLINRSNSKEKADFYRALPVSFSKKGQRWPFCRRCRYVEPSGRCHWTIFCLFFTGSIAVVDSQCWIHCDSLWGSCSVAAFLQSEGRVRVNISLPFTGGVLVLFLWVIFPHQIPLSNEGDYVLSDLQNVIHISLEHILESCHNYDFVHIYFL